ncbi:uncharacterized protein LOC144692354 [Cetorhinus maximus]
MEAMNLKLQEEIVELSKIARMLDMLRRGDRPPAPRKQRWLDMPASPAPPRHIEQVPKWSTKKPASSCTLQLMAREVKSISISAKIGRLKSDEPSCLINFSWSQMEPVGPVNLTSLTSLNWNQLNWPTETNSARQLGTIQQANWNNLSSPTRIRSTGTNSAGLAVPISTTSLDPSLFNSAASEAERQF